MSRLEGRQQRGCWLLPLALIGFLGIGVALGLLISWWLWPVEYTDVSPDTLYPAHRFEYIVLIAQAYKYDGDLRRAQIRLAALGDLAAMGLEVATLAEQRAAQGETMSPVDIEQVRALAALSYALGHRRSTLVAYLPGGPGYVPGAAPTATWTPWPTATQTVPPATQTSLPTATQTSLPTATQTVQPATQTPPATPTLASATPTWTAQATRTRVALASATPSRTPTRPATSTPQPTHTPRPTWTPTVTSTPEPRYALVEQRRVCPELSDGGHSSGGQLRITVLDEKAKQQPNVELLVRWSDGEDRVFTGLKPEIGPGYADLQMEPGSSYQVGVIGIESDIAQGIAVDECPEDSTGRRPLASWEVVFQLSGVAVGE